MSKFITLSAVSLVVASLATAALAQEDQPFANGGFETPDILKGASQGDAPENWFVFSSTDTSKPGITDARKKGGTQSLRFKAQAETNAFMGIAHDFTPTAGHHYSFVVNVMNDPADPLVGAAFGQVSLEWKDAEGKELARNYGPTWNFQLSSSRWEKYQVDADPPDGSTRGVGVVTYFSKDSKGLGTFYLDDTELIDRAP
jgi:hypothetical protein